MLGKAVLGPVAPTQCLALSVNAIRWCRQMFQVRDRLHHPAGGPGPPPGPVHVGHLQPDLVAGIVIWTTALPQGSAYGEAR